MRRIIQKTINAILDILFPRLCLGCQNYLAPPDSQLDQETWRKFICAACRESLKINDSFFCPICFARVPGTDKICHPKSRYLLGSAHNYENPVIRALIHYFKYQYLHDIYILLGENLLQYIEAIKKYNNLNTDNFTVVPIPLHFWRERKRGFNQAYLLAQYLSENMNLPLSNAILRTKSNKPQVGLDSEERKNNMLGCFSVTNPDEIKDKNVLLIDDVFTTGATMNEAAKVLKNNGARNIIALVVAKT